MQPTVVCWPPPAPSRSFVGHLAGMLAGYAVALGAFSWLNPWWSLSLLAWAAMGLSYAAARSRQLVILYIRLPGGAAFGLGGSPGGGGGGGEVPGGAAASAPPTQQPHRGFSGPELREYIQSSGWAAVWDARLQRSMFRDQETLVLTRRPPPPAKEEREGSPAAAGGGAAAAPATL